MTAYGFGRMRILPSGRGQVVCGECRLHMEVKRLAPEEEAVIEAALAEAENTRRNNGWTPLLQAVEALQKERE